MKKTIVYVRSGAISPSSNYRILQYIPSLNRDIAIRALSPEFLYKHHANAVTKFQKLRWYLLYYIVIQFNITRFMIADIFGRPDCIIVQRAISPKFILPWNKSLTKRVYKACGNLIWDFDDEIFNSKEITLFEKNVLQEESRSIIVTSEFLKSRIGWDYQSKVILMPTTDAEFAYVELEDMINIRKSTYNEQIELLWLATSPSLPHLHKIEDILDESAKELKEKYSKELILHVVCNKPLEYSPNYLKLDNIVWSRERAQEMVCRSHIGIMPLTNTISSKGKGGFKIVQYMSAGMPAVASAFGFNNEIVINNRTGLLIDDKENTNGWKEAIILLATNWDRYVEYSILSKAEWEKSFSYDRNKDTWNMLIEGKI